MENQFSVSNNTEMNGSMHKYPCVVETNNVTIPMESTE